MSNLIKHIASLIPGPGGMVTYLRKSGLPAIFPFYHAVSNVELPHIKHLYASRTINQFEKDLDFLLENFQPLKMSEYLSGIIPEDPKRLPMVLSFDDGLIQCYNEILPILLAKGVPAVFFLNNAFIDDMDLFFRFKVSLLVEKLEATTQAEKEKAAALLHCKIPDIRRRLLGISYVEREITDQVAEKWGYSFSEYMKKHPVYLSSMHIRRMLDEGFEIGSHGIDHPMFSLLKKQITIDHIQASVQDLKIKYNLNYRYFAFPFTDQGVEDATIDHLFKRNIIDAGFGTAGLKDDLWPHYYQRIPMEQLGLDARKTLRSELNRRRYRLLAGRNNTERFGKSNSR
ncbi:polysaccharide deacetylase family protein [Bacteroidota bacterium]